MAELAVTSKAAASSSSTSQPGGGGSIPAPRLPKLEIPTFSGELADWPGFYSLFESTINKNLSLSNTEKLQYLKTFLSGSALALIDSLPLLPNNYELAYKTIVDRYQNKRNLGAFYLNKVFSFRQLPSDSLENLRKYYDCFHTTFQAFMALDIADSANFFAMHYALRALDVDTRQRFEAELNMNDIPTFEQLMTFVQKQCHIREISTDADRQPPIFAQKKVLAPPRPIPSSSYFKPTRHTLVSTAQPNVPPAASASCPCAKETIVCLVVQHSRLLRRRNDTRSLSLSGNVLIV